MQSYKEMSECSWASGSGRAELKKGFPFLPCCPVSCQCPWKKTLIEKKKKVGVNLWVTESVESHEILPLCQIHKGR